MTHQLGKRLAGIIGDYRQGQVPAMDDAHVERWIAQFPAGVRTPVLEEVVHVLERTYLSRTTVETFLDRRVTDAAIVGDDPATFWRGVKFLRLQQAGNSQRAMLAQFDASLKRVCGFGIDDCGADPHTHVYLDDAVFSGGRVKSDLVRWIKDEAPPRAKVAVIVVAIHLLGQFFASNDIAAAAAAAGKKLQVDWWRCLSFEDRRAYMAQSDVLRPKSIPAEAQAYVDALGARPVLREGNGVGKLALFSTPAARDLLEQEFLKAGVQVRQRCRNFNEYMRPLGAMLMKTTGFGSMFVTYRNIPNNAPLVLWAGDPWYPLFPRRTN